MNIFIRADSSYSIGAGHIMRCLALAEALREQGHCITFICCELPGNLITLLKDKSFSVIALPHAIKSHQLAQASSIDWLIVDHYELDAAWETACRPFVKKIMVIDDLADRKHDCDVLLDQNYYHHSPPNYAALVPEQCKKLIGPRYALMRAEFHTARQQLTPRNGKVQRLLVSLGGSDPTNGTRKILEGIQLSHCQDVQIDVVMGASSQHRDNIQAFCAARKNHHFYWASNNMADLMQKADLAIGAGGTTTWERCCMGLPSLVIKTASNQNDVIRYGSAANLFAYLGELDQLTEDEIAGKVDEITNDLDKRTSMSKAGMLLVDGLGVNRVVNEMIM